MPRHERKTNSGVSALNGWLETISAVAAVELKDKPEELAKVNKMVADTKDSNMITAAALSDDSINTMHDADDAADAAEQAEAAAAEADAEQPAEQPTGIHAPAVEEE